MISKLVVVSLLLFTQPVYADEKLANAVSYVTVISQITFDSIDSWKADDRKTQFKQQAIRVGITVAASEIIKRIVHKERPDMADDKSFWSEHTALAATSQGWNFQLGIPITVLTATGRVEAKKHFWLDVLVGAGIGTLVERYVH